MAFNIDDFKGVVARGFLKPNRYRVRFPIPPVMLNDPTFTLNYNVIRDLEFWTDSVDCPGVGLLTQNITRYGYGPQEKKPFATSFSNVMMTVYSDSSGFNFAFFRIWAALINNFNMSNGITGVQARTNINAYEMYYKQEYAVDAMVTLIDNAGDDVVTIRLRDFYPIQIPEMKLGYAITNDIQRITVIGSYTDWYLDTNEPGTLMDNLQGLENGTDQNIDGQAGGPPSGPIGPGSLDTQGPAASGGDAGAGTASAPPPDAQVDIGDPFPTPGGNLD